jgi:hypothetical protein
MWKLVAALVAALAILVQGGMAADAEAAKKQRGRQATQITGVIKRVDRRAKTIVVTARAGRGLRRDIRVALAGARITAADANGDGSVGLHDLVPGQRVKVFVKRGRKSRRAVRAARVVVKAPAPRQKPGGDSGTGQGGSEELAADADERDEEAQEPEVDADSLLDAFVESLRRGETATTDSTGGPEDELDQADAEHEPEEDEDV